MAARPSRGSPGCALLLAAVVAGGCTSREPPRLLELAELSPRRVEPGDRLEVVGSGFPEGRPGTLTLDGTLHRPGEEARDLRDVLPARAESQHRVVALVDAERQRRWTGTDGRKATFRGRVVAAFAPKHPGAPPVTGVLEGVVLDLAALPAPPARRQELHAEAERLASHLGVSLSRKDGSLRVARVAPGGPAARAGVEPGDRVVECRGVVAESAADLLPRPGDHRMTCELQRGERLRSVSLDVQGTSRVPPTALALPAAVVAVLGGTWLALALPFSRWVGWVARRAAERVRGRGGRVARRFASGPLLLVWSLASAGFAWLSTGRSWIGPEVDLPLALLGLVALTLTASLLRGGASGRGVWSLRGGLRGVTAGLGAEVPLLLAAASAVVAASGVRAGELALAQGAAPPGWLALRSPLDLLACLLALVCLVPRLSRATGGLPEAETPAPGTTPIACQPEPPADLADAGRRALATFLLAITHLGSWSVPASGASTLDLALPAVVLVVKSLVLLLLVAALRWVMPRCAVHDVSRHVWRAAVPLAVLAAAGSMALSLGVPARALETARPLVTLVLVSLTAGLALVTGLRVALHLRRSGQTAGPNPWL